MIRNISIIILLTIIGILNNIYAQTGGYALPTGIQVPRYNNPVPNPYHPANRQVIQNNWYEATVKYTSYTGHEAIYTLNVKIESDCVITIDFGNGGSVHNGRNNSNYIYKGGNLNFHTDPYGNIQSATTTVYITYYDNTWQKFEILLE